MNVTVPVPSVTALAAGHETALHRRHCGVAGRGGLRLADHLVSVVVVCCGLLWFVVVCCGLLCSYWFSYLLSRLLLCLFSLYVSVVRFHIQQQQLLLLMF